MYFRVPAGICVILQNTRDLRVFMHTREQSCKCKTLEHWQFLRKTLCFSYSGVLNPRFAGICNPPTWCVDTFSLLCHPLWRKNRNVPSPWLYNPVRNLDRLTHDKFLNLIKTLGTTPLVEWSARRKGLYLHRTTQHSKKRTNIHVLSGIRSTVSASKQSSLILQTTQPLGPAKMFNAWW
jgi:hypothetical protein